MKARSVLILGMTLLFGSVAIAQHGIWLSDRRQVPQAITPLISSLVETSS
jgi:hypothetical protein